VTPGPDEGFLHDVIRAGPVRAEPLDVAVQGRGVVRIRLADRGVGVAGLLATALVVLATAASPALALAAGATDSVQRIHRLLGPCEPLGRARRQLLRASAYLATVTFGERAAAVRAAAGCGASMIMSAAPTR
jgi:hypothetical protein